MFLAFRVQDGNIFAFEAAEFEKIDLYIFFRFFYSMLAGTNFLANILQIVLFGLLH